MLRSRIFIFSLAVFTLFVWSAPAAWAGEVVFETTLPWYYGWGAMHWGIDSGTYTREVSIRYTPTANQEVCTIKPGLYRYGNPTDNVVLTVKEGGNGYPPFGQNMATVTIPSSQVSNPPIISNQSTYTAFTFSPCLNLAAGTSYSFVLSRTQLNFNNRYVLQMSNLAYYSQTSIWGFVPVNYYWQELTNYEPALRLEGPDTKEPVIIVPGILGSRLNRVSDGEEVWPNIGEMSIPGPDNYLDDLKLDNNGQEIIDMNSPEIIESVAFLNQYGNLIQKFKDNGYVLGQDLFVVPYDWRLDITRSSLDLDSVISQAVSNSPTGKINLIAHSMGGLLVKDYLIRKGDSAVNKLIFAGTPHLGAPKAFNALNWGDDFDLRFLGLGLNKNKAKDITQNMPAVYELLPSREYLSEAGSYVQNDLDYEQTNEFMFSDPLLSDHRNSGLLTVADQFHQSHDNWLPQSAHIYNLMGCLDPDTIGSFKIGQGGSVDINSVDGDGTVPLISANHIPGKNYFVAYPITKINHTELISNDTTIGLLYNLISSNNEPALPLGIYPSSNCRDQLSVQQASELKRLRFSTHSPVNLHIYDSQGRHTGLTSDGNFETNISDSNFFQVGDNTFISVPGSASYTVKIDAYATGSFDFKVKELDNNDIQNAAIYADVPIKNPTLKADLQFTGLNNLTALNVDEEGDGIDDIGYSLDGKRTFYHDHEPPVITLNGDPVLTLNVHDAYTEQGAEVTDNYDSGLSATIAGEFDTDTVGFYSVHYNAIDSSGNQAIEVIRTVNVVDTEKPVIVLNGSSPVTVPVHGTYAEEGATVNDNYNTDLVPTITGSVNTDQVGSYALQYNAIDSSGNVADEVSRIINVVDNEKPSINLVGANPQVIEVHESYTELGANVSDNFDMDIVPTIDSSAIDTNNVGSYVVHYNVVDSSGNPADQVDRVVNVVDTTKPEINLISPTDGEYERSTIIPVNFTAIDNYILAYATASFDGVNWTGPSIDLFYYPLGPHSFEIMAKDSSGNISNKKVEFRSIATVSSTLSDLERVSALGWTKGSIKNSLTTLLTGALSANKTIISKGKSIDSILGIAFLKQLEKEYNKGNINEQAYKLIREDILWLLGN